MMETFSIFAWNQEPDFSLLGKRIVDQKIRHYLKPELVSLKDGDSYLSLKDSITYSIIYDGAVNIRCAGTFNLAYRHIEGHVDVDYAYDLVEPFHNIFLDKYLSKAKDAKVEGQFKFPQIDEADVKEQLREILK